MTFSKSADFTNSIVNFALQHQYFYILMRNFYN